MKDALRVIATYLGQAFDYDCPLAEDIDIRDIAHQLACINRFQGCTRIPYSVAEHSVRMSYLPMGKPIIHLLHDSAEAYIGDIPRPQKTRLCWVDGDIVVPYKVVEVGILKVIGEVLGVPDLVQEAKSKVATQADNIMLVTEIRDLMPLPLSHSIWAECLRKVEPNIHRIKPRPWKVAEAEFLARYKELTNG